MKIFSVWLEYLLLSVLSLVFIVSPYFRVQVKILVFVAIGLWLAVKLTRVFVLGKKKLFAQNPLQMPFIVFGCVCLLSVLLSQNLYHSQKVFFNRFMIYWLLFLIGMDVVSYSRKNFWWLSSSLIFSSCLLAAGGIRDYLVFHPARLFTVFSLRIPFSMLPLFITYFLPFNFAVLIFCQNRFLRIFSFASLILLFPCAVWQGARAAWVAIAISLLFASFFKNRRIFAGVVLVLLVVFSSGFFFSATRQKLESIPYPSQWNSRTPLYNSALKMFHDHPVFGVGLGMYEKLIKEPRYALSSDYPNKIHILYLHAHNIYLEILAEMGVVGLLAFTFLFLSYFYKVSVALKGIKNENYLAVIIGIASLVVASLVSGVAASIITVGVNETFIFWILLGISLGLLPEVTKQGAIKNG